MHGNFRATTSLIVQGYNNIEYRLCDWCMCLYFTPANYEHIKLLCLSRKDSGKDKIPPTIATGILLGDNRLNCSPRSSSVFRGLSSGKKLKMHKTTNACRRNQKVFAELYLSLRLHVRSRVKRLIHDNLYRLPVASVFRQSRNNCYV